MTQAKPTREERLAAKLRENLHRRKAQARAVGGRAGGGQDVAGTEQQNESGGVSKVAPES